MQINFRLDVTKHFLLPGLSGGWCHLAAPVGGGSVLPAVQTAGCECSDRGLQDFCESFRNFSLLSGQMQVTSGPEEMVSQVEEGAWAPRAHVEGRCPVPRHLRRAPMDECETDFRVVFY